MNFSRKKKTVAILELKKWGEHCGVKKKVGGPASDEFKERGVLGHLSFWSPRKCNLFGRLFAMLESMPLLCVVPPQKSLLLCRLWFYSCLRSSTEIKAFFTYKPFLHTSEKKALPPFLGVYSCFL